MEVKGAFTRYEKPILINNSQQILQLKMIGENRYFIRNDFPFGAVWRGDNQSSAFYAYISQTDANIFNIEELDRMDLKLKNKISSDEILADVISPLLNIIENGWYQIFYHEPSTISIDSNSKLSVSNLVGVNNYNFINKFNENEERSNVWIDDTILFTQNYNTLKRETIEHYKNEVNTGKRPTIVTMGVASLNHENIEEYNKTHSDQQRATWVLELATHSIEPQFIIDGHHKAQAYIELKVKPSIISCIKLQFKNEANKFIANKSEIQRLIEYQIKEKIEKNCR